MNSPEFPQIHFVGLGPGKAGTTYIYGYLDQHPNVSVGIVKESYYFSREFHRGRNWYLKLKNIYTDATRPDILAFGDISNQYFKDLNCIQRVESEFPNSKYIFFQRRPLSRLISCYKFEKKMGYRGDINEYLLTQSPAHFNNEDILQNIYQLVPKSSVFVVDFDLLSREPAKVLDKLTGFLNVPSFEADADIFRNPSVLPRSSHFAVIGRGVAKALRRLKLYSLLQFLKNSDILRKVFFTSAPIEISEVEIEVARQFLNQD